MDCSDEEAMRIAIKNDRQSVMKAKEAWQQAAVYRITLPLQSATNASRMLTIDYQGDCARLYANGKLIADNFYYGRPFLYGLWRLPSDVTELELRILPLQPDAPIYLPREAERKAGESLKRVAVTQQ